MKELDQEGKKAERIVNEYGDTLSSSSDGIAKPESLLKNPKEAIREAIRQYILSLIKAGKLTKELIEVLSLGYASLELFVDDDRAELINTLGNQDKKDLPKELFKIHEKFVTKATDTMKERVVEITEFIKSNY